MTVNIELFVSLIAEQNSKFNLKNSLQSVKRRYRSLLSDADVEKSGIIRTNTQSGANLTSDAVLFALVARIKSVKKNEIPRKKTREVAIAASFRKGRFRRFEIAKQMVKE